MSAPRLHVPEIDVLKGFCILCVVAIHGAFLAGHPAFEFLINRAVPVFLVLFGVTSELWWHQNKDAPAVTRRFYVSRLKRIVPGYWAMMACWWLVVAFWRRPDNELTLGWPQVAISFLGAAGWVGTTWFVTLILQYLVAFPLLRRAASGVWSLPVLGLSAAATGLAGMFMLDVLKAGEVVFGKNVQELYYYWVSFPRALWHVVAGILIARWWQGRVGLPATLIACAVSVCAATALTLNPPLSWDWGANMRRVAYVHWLDVPLAVALLGLCRWLPLPRVVRAGLSWCGRWSWGIYMAHLLVHEVLHIAGFDPSLHFQWLRGLYALGLLLSGIGIAVCVERAVGFARRSFASSARTDDGHESLARRGPAST